jgi:pyruvate/2-oxoglutarate dehydrogenase complex dihydrolipoamide acyltransferase (E2) component
MRALRVVGYGEDGVVILEDPDRRERFTVPADERLRAAARGDVQRLGQMSMELESQLRPREIQSRIRAGASVEQVAAAAGVPLQRIERFAYPVLLERSRTSEMARQAHPVREDGPDLRTLDEVVEHTFGLRGQEYSQVEWDSFRGEDNKWVVALSWSVGRSEMTARWTYHPGAHGGTVTALDEHATDLVDGHLSRPPRRVGPVIDFSKPDGAEETDSPPATSTPAPKASSPSTTERSTAANDRPTDRANSAAAERAANRATGTDQSAGRRATKTTTGSGPRGRAEAAKSGQGDGGSNPGAAEPAKPDSSTGAAAKRPASRKAKPVMPSWEDVLLGVKRS